MNETVTLYKCDKCKGLIRNPKDGVIVHGNIYVADTGESRGGLIGNNFPTEPPKHGHYPECENVVKESVYCQPCFLKIVFPDLKIQTTRCDGGLLV